MHRNKSNLPKSPLPILVTLCAVLATIQVTQTLKHDDLRGPNVCVRASTQRKERRIEVPRRIEIKYQTLCMGIIPCTKSRFEESIDSQLVPEYEEIDQFVCCPGYAETIDRHCIPVCTKSCNNGKCIKPEVCECNPRPTETSPGYTGAFCNRYTCQAPNKWGSKCDLECDCSNPNSYCSANTGKCSCRAGWRGANCTEECTPSMNCFDVELPPIIEPEVNLILDSTGSAQRLEAIDPSALGRDAYGGDNAGSRSVASLVAAHMGLNLLLIVLTFGLVFALFIYRRKLNKIRQELYYAAPYSAPPTDGSDSTYTAPSLTSTVSRMQNRPRMPTPLEDNFFGKNLSFALATRELLSKAGSVLDNNARSKCVVDPKIESHLIASQKSSTGNVYSNVDSVPQVSTLALNRLDALPERFPEPQPNIARDDNQYQVPRSARTNVSVDLADQSQTSADQTISFYAEGANSDQLNIYEEIKPRSTSQ